MLNFAIRICYPFIQKGVTDYDRNCLLKKGKTKARWKRGIFRIPNNIR